MKFPYLILAILMLIGIAGVLFTNINIDYNELEPTLYVSPEHGSIKMNTNLYFVFEDSLRIEKQNIQVDEANYGKAILDALKSGALNKLYKSVFNFQIEIDSVEVVGDTCYVNIVNNEAFAQLLTDENLPLYIWSVVNSLTDFNKIKNVQFLIDDNYYDKSLNGFNLNKPLVKRESLVYQKKNTPIDVVIDFVNYMNTMRYDLAYSLLTKNTMQDLDYSSFVRYANSYKKKHNEYTITTYYSYGYLTYSDVIVNYSKDLEADGLSLKITNTFKVIKEEDVFRINLDTQLN